MLKKIITTICLFFALSNIFLLLPINQASANTVTFKPQITLGDFKAGEEKTIGPNTLAEYIREIYKYALGFVGILATAVMMFGGFLWITAAGNGERVSNAKSWIGAALSGMILALCSYTILWMVNPNLVKFSSIDVATPDTPAAEDDTIGCCQCNGTAYEMYETSCTGDGCTWKTGLGTTDNKTCNESDTTTTGCCMDKLKLLDAGIVTKSSCKASTGLIWYGAEYKVSNDKKSCVPK